MFHVYLPGLARLGKNNKLQRQVKIEDDADLAPPACDFLCT